MKKILLILPVLFFALSVFADEVATEQQAESMYREGKYREAADAYTQMLAGGKESAALYYNLGNCFYKMGENTDAILNYERSLLLNPADEMARYNLKLAQNGVVDKIEVLPELFLLRWYKAVETHFSADQWGYISVGLFILFLVLAALFFYSSSAWIKKTGFAGGIFILLFCVWSVVFAVKQNYRIQEREYAIVITPSVTVKGAPDVSGTELFLIHEGLKVKVVGALGDWYNIRLADGNEGWVAKPDLEKI